MIAKNAIAQLDAPAVRKSLGIGEKDAGNVKAVLGVLVGSGDIFATLRQDGAKAFQKEGIYQMLGGIVANAPAATIAAQAGRAMARNATLVALTVREGPFTAMKQVQKEFLEPVRAISQAGVSMGPQMAKSLVQKGQDLDLIQGLLNGLGGMLVKIGSLLSEMPLLGKLIGFIAKAGQSLIKGARGLGKTAELLKAASDVASLSKDKAIKALADAKAKADVKQLLKDKLQASSLSQALADKKLMEGRLKEAEAARAASEKALQAGRVEQATALAKLAQTSQAQAQAVQKSSGLPPADKVPSGEPPEPKKSSSAQWIGTMVGTTAGFLVGGPVGAGAGALLGGVLLRSSKGA
jgi:hypothetical protein